MTNTNVTIDLKKLDVAWQKDKDYTITFDRGFIREVGNNRTINDTLTNVLNADNSVFVHTFTTDPNLVSIIPESYSTNIANPTIELKYDRLIFQNSGTIAVKNLVGTVLYQMPMTDTRVSVVGDTISVDLTIPNTPRIFTGGEQFYVNLSSGYADDVFNFQTQEISDNSSIRYTYKVAPFVQAVEPVYDTSNTFTNKVSLTFNRNIDKNINNIRLYKEGAGLVKNIPISDSSITVNNNTATINLFNNLGSYPEILDGGKTFYLTMDYDNFVDEYNLPSASITDNSLIKFTQLPNPVVQSVSPTLDSVIGWPKIALIYNRAMQKGTGNFYVYKQDFTDELIATIPTNDSRITIKDSECRFDLTGLTFDVGASYYLTADAGSLSDTYFLINGSIADDGTLRFSFMDSAKYPMITLERTSTATQFISQLNSFKATIDNLTTTGTEQLTFYTVNTATSVTSSTSYVANYQYPISVTSGAINNGNVPYYTFDGVFDSNITVPSKTTANRLGSDLDIRLINSDEVVSTNIFKIAYYSTIEKYVIYVYDYSNSAKQAELASYMANITSNAVYHDVAKTYLIGTFTNYSPVLTLGTSTSVANTATISVPAGTLPIGSHKIAVKWNGRTIYPKYYAGWSNTLTNTIVDKNTTALSLSANASTYLYYNKNRSVNTTPVTFTTVLSAITPYGFNPTGSLRLLNSANNGVLSTSSISNTGTFTFPFNFQVSDIGSTRSFKTTYVGDDYNKTSTSSIVSVVVNKLNTTIGLATNDNSITRFDTVQLSASKPADDTLTSSITFLQNGSSVGTAAFVGNTATITIEPPTGTINYVANYPDETVYYTANSNTVPITVVKYPNTATITQVISSDPFSSGQTQYKNAWPWPLLTGNTATFTISTTATRVRSNVLTVKNNTTATLGSVTLVNNSATFSTTGLVSSNGVYPGTALVSVTDAGDADYSPFTSNVVSVPIRTYSTSTLSVSRTSVIWTYSTATIFQGLVIEDVPNNSKKANNQVTVSTGGPNADFSLITNTTMVDVANGNTIPIDIDPNGTFFGGVQRTDQWGFYNGPIQVNPAFQSYTSGTSVTAKLVFPGDTYNTPSTSTNVSYDIWESNGQTGWNKFSTATLSSFVVTKRLADARHRYNQGLVTATRGPIYAYQNIPSGNYVPTNIWTAAVAETRNGNEAVAGKISSYHTFDEVAPLGYYRTAIFGDNPTYDAYYTTGGSPSSATRFLSGKIILNINSMSNFTYSDLSTYNGKIGVIVYKRIAEDTNPIGNDFTNIWRPVTSHQTILNSYNGSNAAALSPLFVSAGSNIEISFTDDGIGNWFNGLNGGDGNTYFSRYYAVAFFAGNITNSNPFIEYDSIDITMNV